VNSFPKTVTRQRRDCDLNPGPSAPESSTVLICEVTCNVAMMTERSSFSNNFYFSHAVVRLTFYLTFANQCELN